ncbi:MAG: HEAT repeat domain-containing protein, partial [Cyanobacteria bacterium J06635_15]
RSNAARALGAMGDAAATQAPKLVALIENPDEDNNVRFAAAYALGQTGEAAAAQAPKLVALIADPDENNNVRYAAASALGGMGEATAAQVPKLVALIENPDEDNDVRSAAASALGVMGDAAAAQAPKLGALIENPDEDSNARSNAARALGAMGDAAAAQAPKLGALIENPDEDNDVRSAAARALGAMGEAAAAQAPKLRSLLADQWRPFDGIEEISVTAANALNEFGPSGIETVVHVLDAVSRNNFRADFFRFTAYYLSDGNEDAITLIQWLGVRNEEYLPNPTKLSHKEAKRILQIFADAWPQDNAVPSKLRFEWPRQIANIVETNSWNTSDLPLLRKHYKSLRAIRSTQAASIASEITTLERWRSIWIGRNIWLGHAIFWLLLIFVYPKSPQIQAIFFWNPWVRRIFGAGYIGFALTWIPFLRARLFAPLQDSLLANAGLAGFTPAAYFPDSTIENKATGNHQPLQQAIPTIKGQIILEGESGLGKTMFVRHIIQKTLQQQAKRGRWQIWQDLIRPPRTMVFLPADRCADGVSEAIQVKLHGLAKDPRFLRDLIYSGAIDICIDGLNEVTADTRAKITEFVERYFKGNIIMTTQPLEWRPPATATSYVLKPLERDKVQDFLASRESVLPEDAPVRGDAYTQACQHALKDALTPNQPVEELAAAKRILSNPMDLSIVAQMIANKEPPNLFQLQHQQYKLMAADYQRLHLREFPLQWFSEWVYDMRLNDQTAIPEAEFFDELQCMERHKMVTCRQGLDSEGQPTKEWNFRHDKIMEFFIVQTFLGQDNDRPQKHMSDPRFRGVYFLLAKLLPWKDALALREELINYAADTRDHTVSDDFVQLLRSRKTIEAV